MERCEVCSFVYDDVAVTEIAPELRTLPARYAVQLRRAADDGVERLRPAPDVWSILEYTCHVRDVVVLQRHRLQLALVHDEPVFAPMDRDRLVVDRHYQEQRIDRVVEDLTRGVAELADAFEHLTDAQWRRTGVHDRPPPGPRTMAWLGRHTVHEGVHHLGDLVDVRTRLRNTGR